MHFLALDQGTTSSRAIIFDLQGQVVCQAQREFTQFYPQPSWVEHDPLEIWDSQLAVAKEVLAKVSDVAAIGITNQRETTLIWERKSGRPIHPAIVWQDRRTASLCDKLREDGLEELFRTRTGLRLDPYFSGTKLAWLLEHIPDLRERAIRGDLAFGTVDSWLIYQLSGGRLHATDVTNASRTLLFNIHTLEWDAELLEILNIPKALLPKVHPSSALFGEADVLGGRPICGVAGDQHAALFGQGCSTPGMAKNTYGTGCFMLMNTGSAMTSHHGLLTTPAWSLPEVQYALEGSVFVAGALVQWLRDELGLIKTSRDIEALAQSVSDSNGVSIVPAFTGLGAPYWDAGARGAILGLSRGTNRAHIAHAALEAIAWQVQEVFAAMALDSGITLSELRVDGGAAQNNLLMQIQADALGIPVVRPKQLEATALGAAQLAALGIGYEIKPEPGAATIFEPRIDAGKREEHRQHWQDAVNRVRSIRNSN